jgi:predicted nucleotidyltransferase
MAVIKLQQAIQLLADSQVEFVIIGGIAITLHGSSYLTSDLDLCYARSGENLTRIVYALKPYNPRLRVLGVPQGVPLVWDEQTLRNGLNFTLITELGEIDLLGEVSGIGGFDEALAASVPVALYEHEIHILSLEGLIKSKRAAGRPKDLLVLAELEALQELLEETGGE